MTISRHLLSTSSTTRSQSYSPIITKCPMHHKKLQYEYCIRLAAEGNDEIDKQADSQSHTFASNPGYLVSGPQHYFPLFIHIQWKLPRTPNGTKFYFHEVSLLPWKLDFTFQGREVEFTSVEASGNFHCWGKLELPPTPPQPRPL